jgi:signal transduction histidine kinase
MRWFPAPWIRSLRVRLTLTSISVVMIALLIASVSFLWVFESQLIGKIRERDRTIAVQEALLAVYSARFPVLFPLVNLPGLEGGTIVQVLGEDGALLDERRGDPLTALSPRFPKANLNPNQFPLLPNGLDAQREFEEVFVELDDCLVKAGINPRDFSTAFMGQTSSVRAFIQINFTNQALESCFEKQREAFTHTSKIFTERTAKSEVARSWYGKRSLTTGVSMLRPDGVTPVTAVVVTSLYDIDQRITTLRNGLAIGLPLLIGIVGLVSWTIVGRSLKPVEAIRQEVVAIAHTTLDRRIPEPAMQDELGRLAQTMNEMLDRLEGAAKVQRQFVSDASHELKSPLASMRAQLEVSLAHPELTPWKTVASNVLEESMRMQHLINELLELAHMDEQDIESYLGEQSILDLDDLVFTEAKTIGNRHVRTEGVSAGQVRGNANQLRQVLRNLLDNAARYAKEEIRIGLETVQNQVILVVEDDGPGIPPHERSRIFDRFARAEESRSRSVGGAGLGLAVVQGIVTRHGGSITVGRAGIGGARFEVTLPAATSMEYS